MTKINNSLLISESSLTYALSFAMQAHQGQFYGNLPYMVHINGVLAEVVSIIRHPNEVIEDSALLIQVAILHDVIEDTDVTHWHLVNDFGLRVANGVVALSKNPDLPKEKQMQDSVRRIKNQPLEVGIVKLADRISNLQYMHPKWNKNKVKSYIEESVMILENLGHCSKYLNRKLNFYIQNQSGSLRD